MRSGSEWQVTGKDRNFNSRVLIIFFFM